jgi:hypothetical protein
LLGGRGVKRDAYSFSSLSSSLILLPIFNA